MVDYGTPLGNLESAQRRPGSIQVSGWATDPETTVVDHGARVRRRRLGRRVHRVRKPARRRSVVLLARRRARLLVLAPGRLRARTACCVYAINVGAGSREPAARAAPRPSACPVGNFESATRSPGSVRLTGWAIDPDTADPATVHVYVDGGWGGAYTASGDRARPRGGVPRLRREPRLRHDRRDRGRHPPGVRLRDQRRARGAEPAARLPHRVGHAHRQLRVARRGARARCGSRGGRSIPTPRPATCTCTSTAVGAARTPRRGNRARRRHRVPRLRRRPRLRPTVAVGAGTHQVCVYAINVGPAAANPPLGCRTVVGHAHRQLRVGDRTGNAVRLTGWALDPDTANPVTCTCTSTAVGRRLRRVRQPRRHRRPRSPATDRTTGSTPPSPSRSGRHQVCVYAINVGPAAANPLLGCRSA